jgi:hypothetical protein
MLFHEICLYSHTLLALSIMLRGLCKAVNRPLLTA